MDLSRFEQKTKITERGDLMTYFCKELNKGRKEKGLKDMSIPRVAKMIKNKYGENAPLWRLYEIKSICDEWSDQGKPFGALFHVLCKSNEEKTRKEF